MSEADASEAKATVVNASTGGAKTENAPIGNTPPPIAAKRARVDAVADSGTVGKLSGGGPPSSSAVAAKPPHSAPTTRPSFAPRAWTSWAIPLRPRKSRLSRSIRLPTSGRRPSAAAGRARFGENWARYWRDVILYPPHRRSGNRFASNSLRLLDRAVQQERPPGTRSPGVHHGHRRRPENGTTAIIMPQEGQARRKRPPKCRASSWAFRSSAASATTTHDRWKRKQFHELAAFFPREACGPLQTARGAFQVVSDDRPRDRPRNPSRVAAATRALHARSEEPGGQGHADAAEVFSHASQLPRARRTPSGAARSPNG